MRLRDCIVINGRLEAQTGKAILVQSDYMEEPVWLPKSQVMFRRETEGSDRVEVEVPGWLVTKNNLR